MDEQKRFRWLFNELDEKIDLVIDQLLERMEIQGNKRVKNFPFLMGQGIWRGSDNLSPEDTLKRSNKTRYINSRIYRISRMFNSFNRKTSW